MRKRIYEIIEVAADDDKASTIYDIFMMITIFASIVPLAFIKQYSFFSIIDAVTVFIFVIDYFLRFITADYKLKEGMKSFCKYPFSVMAIIDLLSILPSLTLMLNSAFKLLKLIRLLRCLRLLKVFKAARYSKNLELISLVLKKEKDLLLTVVWIAVVYVLILALVILNIEPDTFQNGYFDAVYWATVSLTTMGYGDLYPLTNGGRVITMISSFVGIAVVALPSGIITSGMIDVMRERKKN